MSRPAPWLFRLSDIRRAVKNSVRSHYERKHFERLFELQPRAAQNLMQTVFPAAKVGRSFLVESSDLQAFLDQLAESDDPQRLLAQRRALTAEAPAPRRTIREFITTDRIPATFESLPANLEIQSGEIKITFTRIEELVGALCSLAEVLYDPAQFQKFEAQVVPLPCPEPRDEQDEMKRLFVALERMEKAKRAG